MSTHAFFVDSTTTMAVYMKDDIHSVRRSDKEYRRCLLKNKGQLIWHDYKVGVIPFPLFILAGGLVVLNCVNDTFSSDIVVMVVTLAFLGFACGEFGRPLPLVGKILRHLYSLCTGVLRSVTTGGGGISEYLLSRQQYSLSLYLLHHCGQHA